MKAIPLGTLLSCLLLSHCSEPTCDSECFPADNILDQYGNYYIQSQSVFFHENDYIINLPDETPVLEEYQIFALLQESHAAVQPDNSPSEILSPSTREDDNPISTLTDELYSYHNSLMKKLKRTTFHTDGSLLEFAKVAISRMKGI